MTHNGSYNTFNNLTCQELRDKIFTIQVYIVYKSGDTDMDGYEKRRNEKKESILKTALELFCQYGFDRITMTEIAGKARVSKVSIYNFFESKDNLRRVIVKNMMDKSLEQTFGIIGSNDDFIEKIKKYLRSKTIYGDERVFKFFFEAVESDSSLRQVLNDFSVANKRLVLTLIKEGKDAGWLSPDISDSAIEIYIDIFQSYILRLNKDSISKSEYTPRLAEEINQLFLEGLLIRDAGRNSSPAE